MDEEDYACNKFIPQKWRKDVCKLCFQPKRLHEKKVKKIVIKQEDALPTDHNKSVDKGSSNSSKRSSIENPLESKQQEQELPEIPSSDQNDQIKEIVPISGDDSHTDEPATLMESSALLDTNALATKNTDIDVSSSDARETCTGGTEGDYLLKRNIEKTAPLVEQDKLADTPFDHAQLVSDLHDEDSNIAVVMQTSDTMSPSAVETLQADSCKDKEESVKTEMKTEMNIQEVDVRTDACDPEEVEQKQDHDDQEKTNYPERVKQEGLLDTEGDQNEDDGIEDVTSNSEDKEVVQDHDIKEDISDHEEVKQKEQGLDVNINDTSDSDKVKYKEVLQGAQVQEDTLSFEDIGQQKSTVADIPLSDDTVLDSSQPVTSDDVAPHFDENATPPATVAAMAAANYPSNIPIPPPPPPIGGSSPAPVPPVQNTSPEVPDSRGNLLREIRSGTQLKNVPWPKQKEVGEVEVTNIQTELQRMVLKRRKQEVSDTVQKLDEHKEEVDRFIKDIMDATRHSQRLVFLRMLQQQLSKFLQDSQISLEILEKRRGDWPVHQVCALQEVLEFMDKLEGRVCHVETICQNSLSTVNPEAVEKCTNEIVRLAKETNQTATSRFSLATSTVKVSQTDIDSLMLRASNALIPVLDKLYEKAFAAYRAVMDGTAGKFDLKFRLTNAQRLLKMCCHISDSSSMYLQIAKHVQYSEAQLKVKELQTEFDKAFQVNDRKGEWDVDQSVVLKATDVPRNPDSLPRKMQESYLNLQKLVKCIQSGSSSELDTMLHNVDTKLYRINEMQLIKAAMLSKDVKVVKGVATMRGSFDDDEDLKHVHDYDWLCEAITTGFPSCIEVLVEECDISINAQSIDAAHTALHIAARKGDFSTVIKLLRLGADPLLVNSSHHTPLQLIAIKHFPSKDSSQVAEKEYLFDLSEYLCSTTLSDVTLVSKDGKKFPAHRLVLCAQSGYFKALLESNLWQEGQGNEVTIPSVESSILKIMLEYMYTGKCLFPRDDLNKAIELMATAEMFLLEPMRVQCETVLSEKLDSEVVVPIFQAATVYAPKRKLYCNCGHYILKNYKDIEDPDYEVLYQILENQISTT
ncbi:uncharacterized protein [Dysidea avara]|uniref:uncharacterized protein n=1 Tax=Dysidea avara TaxID=196820 RepID=UPI0033189A3A